MFTYNELLFLWDALAVCPFTSIQYNGVYVNKEELKEKIAEIAENNRLLEEGKDV